MENKKYAIQVAEHTYFWSNEDERVLIINEGFPYEVIDALEVKTSILWATLKTELFKSLNKRFSRIQTEQVENK